MLAMADPGIKKVIINKAALPGVRSDNKYYIRYRIVSEDKNRVSHWSPIHSVDSLAIDDAEGEVSVSGKFTVVVLQESLNKPKYDVFVKFDNGGYVYHGTSSTNTYSFINTGTSTVKVAVQIESSSKVRSNALTIFESGTVSLV
jgi:hypothetical protein